MATCDVFLVKTLKKFVDFGNPSGNFPLIKQKFNKSPYFNEK